MDTLRSMSKSFKIEGNPFASSHQRNQIFLKFVAFFLLIGLAYRFIVTDSSVSPVTDFQISPESLPVDPSGLTAVAQAPEASVDSPGNITIIASQNGKRGFFPSSVIISTKFENLIQLSKIQFKQR